MRYMELSIIVEKLIWTGIGIFFLSTIIKAIFNDSKVTDTSKKTKENLSP